jgi:hypothetical protein
MLARHRWVDADARPRRLARQAATGTHRSVAYGEPPGPSVCHLVPEAQRAFRPRPVAIRPPGGVRRLLISSIYHGLRNPTPA